MEKKDHGLIEPGALLAGVLLTTLLALFLCSIIFGLQFNLIRRFPLGLDFVDFYRGAQNFVAGFPLYVDPRFVTPPTAAMLLAPLTFFSQHTATIIYIFINVLCIFFGLVLLKKESGCSWLIVPAGLASCPAVFLFERGNIDGFVFLLITFTLVYWNKREGLVACALAFACLLKVYPVLLFVPALIERRWRMIFIACVVAFIFVIITPSNWYNFLSERVFGRSIFFDPKENISLINGLYFLRELLCMYVGKEFNYTMNAGISAEYGIPLWIFGFSIFSLFFNTARHHKELGNEKNLSLLRILFVFPMFLYPAQVYQYSQIMNLIVFVFLWKMNKTEASLFDKQWIYHLVLLCIAISCTYNYAFVLATGSIYFYGIVPLANLFVFLLMVVLVSKKLLLVSKEATELTSSSAAI